MVTDDEIQAVFAESQRLLESTADLKFERRNPSDEDVLERWRRGQPQPEQPPRPREPTGRDIERLRARQWDQWLRAHLDAERRLTRETLGKVLAVQRDALGQVIGGERKKHADEIARLEARIAAVEAKLQHAKGDGGGELVDLPAFVRKRDAA